MTLVLVSNYLNAHMVPLCEALQKNEDVEAFTFIATTPFGEERAQMGFANEQDKAKYVYKAYEGVEQYKVALKLVQAADVAIIAHAPDEFVHARMKENKLTFLCSERFYKLGLWRRFVPSSYMKKQKRFLQYKDKSLYYLTIGAYTPFDLHLVGFPLEKCFQWAYFPKTLPVPKEQLKQRDVSEKLKLFWAGRMVHKKHPEIAIKIARKLKQKKIDFEMNMAGDGVNFQKMRRLIERYAIDDAVHLLGNCPPSVVQRYMCESDIFLFTSDYWEGWGAVLSEAMGVGCVPITSIAAGASLILVKSGENGFVYHKLNDILEYVITLNSDTALQNKMALNAWKTINFQWGATKAVDNFVKIVNGIQSGTVYEVEKGPMKKSELQKACNYFGTDF